MSTEDIDELKDLIDHNVLTPSEILENSVKLNYISGFIEYMEYYNSDWYYFHDIMYCILKYKNIEIAEYILNNYNTSEENLKKLNELIRKEKLKKICN